MGQYLRLAIGLLLLQMAAGQRNEDVLQRGVPRRQVRERQAAALQEREERRQSEVRLCRRQAIGLALHAGRADGGELRQVALAERRRGRDEREFDDVLAAELGDELGWRAESDDLAVIDDRHAI